MSSSTRSLAALLLTTVLLLPATGAAAQSPDDDPDTEEPREPLLESLNERLKNPYFALGVFVQGIADFQPERHDGTNGFQLAKARLKAQGTLDGGWGYKLQSDFTRNVSLLDALVRYQPTDWLEGRAGLFKTPFSYEYLISSSRVKFVGRPQVIGNLAPRRHVGLSAAVTPVPDVTVQGGIFNGNGRTAALNDNNQFLYAGRLTFTPQRPLDALTLGTSVAYNDRSNLYERPDGEIVYVDDASTPTGMDAVGSKLLLGGDVHVEQGPWLAGVEAIYGRFAQDAADDQTPFGHYVTLGYDLPTRTPQQVLVRWDAFTPDVGEAASSDLLIAGYNLWPTSVVQVQVNYAVPAGDPAFENHRVLADLQIAW